MSARGHQGLLLASGIDDHDPYWNDVTVLLRGATDLKGNSWSLKGTTTVDPDGLAPGVPAIVMDGTLGGYVQLNGSPPALGAGDFTIEGFISVDAVPEVAAAFFNTYPPGIADTLANLGVFVFPSGPTVYFTYNNRSGNFARTADVTTGVVHHLALCRQSGVNSLYLNGVASATSYELSDPNAISALELGWANYQSTAGRYLQGKIGEFRITKGVARYTANFAPPTAPFPNHA